jgi:hypothetical protein
LTIQNALMPMYDSIQNRALPSIALQEMLAGAK